MKGITILATFLLMFGIEACSSSTTPIDGNEDFAESSSSAKGDNSSSSTIKDSSSSTNDDDEKETCQGKSGKAWDGSTAKEFACGHGTRLSPYIILTAEQLAKLSFIVGAKDSNYNADSYFKLGADIILHEEKLIDGNGALSADSAKLIKWTPIGNSTVSFAAHFDGNGHSVSGIFINTSSTHNGLFGNVSGIVQNVSIKNSWIKGGKYTAGIVGYNVGTIENAENEASVTETDECVGGVVGKTEEKQYKYNSILNDVSNKGVVSGKDNVGGIAGCAAAVSITGADNKAEINGQHLVGGIIGGIGSYSKNNIKKVKNRGKVSGKHFVGGVAGHCGGILTISAGSIYCLGSYSCGSINYALNSSNITGENGTAGIIGDACYANLSNAGNTGNVEGKISTAGIIGYSGYSTTSSLYNTGKVFGSKNVGGIIGYNQEGVTNSAYTTGKVDGDENVGIMIGQNYNTTMADYYYLAQGKQDSFGINDGGGFATAKTEEEMRTVGFLELLGDGFVLVENSNEGFPLLKWEIAE